MPSGPPVVLSIAGFDPSSGAGVTADIKTAEDAVRMQRETGCAAIMIARGSFGQPWIFDETRALLEGKPKPEAPPIERRFEIALEHARMAAAYEADPHGAAIEFRKHLGWYVKGVPGSAELRRKLHAVVSLGEVEDVFATYLASPRYDETPALEESSVAA